MLASGLGLCAATSLAVPSGNPTEPRASDRRVVELGVLAPIVFGGLLLGVALQGATLAAITLVGQAAVIAVLLAGSAWLLLARASSDTEQRVFAIAAMLLVGGAADYLSLSALLSGLMAGAFWRLAGGPAEASLRRDARYVQHSLLVLVLVVAGARTDFTLTSVAVAAMYVFLRIVQWIASERAGESYIPMSFWYLSVVGSLVMLVYAIHRKGADLPARPAPERLRLHPEHHADLAGAEGLGSPSAAPVGDSGKAVTPGAKRPAGATIDSVLRILYVEDDATAREYIEKGLTRAGLPGHDRGRREVRAWGLALRRPSTS